MNKAILFVLWLGICLRIYYFFFNPSLWGDEATLANNIIKYDAYYLCTGKLDDGQTAPPLYLISTKLLGAMGNYTEKALRASSLIFGIGALLIFWRTTRLLLNPLGQLISLTLFSLGAYLIYHSSEVKQYSAEAFVSVLIMYLAISYRYGFTYKQAWIGSVIFIFCVMLSFSSIFVLGGVFAAILLYILLKKKYAFVPKVFICGLGWTCVFLIYYVAVLSKSKNVDNMFVTWQSEFFPLPLHASAIRWYLTKIIFIFNNPLAFSIDTDFFPSLFIRWRYIVYFSYTALVVVIASVWAVWHKSKYVAALLLMPVLLTIVASVLQKYPFYERFLLFLVPIVYLIIGYISEIQSYLPKQNWLTRYKIIPVLTGLTLGYILFNISYKVIRPDLFGGSTKFSEYREAIAYIDQHKKSTEPVYVAWSSERFYNYYTYTKHIQWSVIKGQPPEINTHSRAEIENNIRQILIQDLKNHKRVWFLLQSRAYPLPFTGTQGNEKPINEPLERLFYKVLQENGTILQTFSGNPVKAYLVELSKK